jgi:hypothetical protein
MNTLLKNVSYASFITSFLFAALPMVALAQESPYGNRVDAESAVASGAYHPPALYVSAITLDSKNITKEVKGSFHVLNQAEDILGDIKYRFEILSPLQKGDGKEVVIADAPNVYTQIVSTDTFAFIPNEERDIPFSYTIPSLPSGEYRVRIQLITTQGKELGWNDEVVQVTGGSLAFATLTHGPIKVPTFKNEVIPPTFGVAVPGASSITLTAQAENVTDTALSATPMLDIYTYGLTGKKVSSIPGAAITIAPKKTQQISIPVKTETLPGVYYAVLTLQAPQGVQASSLTDYRWIVQGESAHIISARIAKLATRQGEKVVVNVDYAGPADAKTTIKGRIAISVLDQQGTAGTLEVPTEITFRDAIESGEAKVTLSRDLVGAPGLQVTLTDLSGKLLDTYMVSIPLTQQQLDSAMGVSPVEDSASPSAVPEVFSPKKKMVMIVLAGLLVVLLAVYAVWKRRSMSAVIPSLFLLLLLGGGLAAFPAITEAGIRVVFPKTGSEVGDEWKSLHNYIVEIFVNKPIHNATYAKESVPLDFRVVYGTSNSSVAYARNFFRYVPTAHVSTYEGAWVSLGNTTFSSGVDACSGGNNDKCFVPNTYSTPAGGGFNFALQPAQSTQATLQLISKWAVGGIPSSTLPGTAAELSGLADGINTWVNFNPSGPVVSVTPTPLVCADNARVAVDFIEIDTSRRANENPTNPITFYGNGEQAADAKFVDLTRNGQAVIDGKLPFNVDGLAAERGDGFITFQLYSKGHENKGKECIIADIDLQNATFTRFQNIGGSWQARTERPEDGKWRFCKNGKDEIWPGIGSTHAEMMSSAGPGNDTFTLFYKNDAPQGTPVCTVPPSPDVTVNLLINGTDNPGTVSANTPVTLSWTSTNADTCTAARDWTGVKAPAGSENTTPTQVRPYAYIITCKNTITGKVGFDTANLLVGPANTPPVAVAKFRVLDATNAPASSSITVTRGVPVNLELNAEGSSDPDGWTTPNRGVSSNGFCEWNSDLNQGTATFETNRPNPSSPSTCNASIGPRTFNDAPGTYTYNLLRITDASGAVSNIGNASVTVVAPSTTVVTPTPTPTVTVTPIFNPGGFVDTR